jgi:hypothetical protein
MLEILNTIDWNTVIVFSLVTAPFWVWGFLYLKSKKKK